MPAAGGGAHGAELESGEVKRQDGIVEITRRHLDSIAHNAGIMLDMVGPFGFNRPDLAVIVQDVVEALLTAVERLDRVGQPAPKDAS